MVNISSIEKVQKELDAVLGPSQMICYEHRRKVPYTNAVIHEIQRFSNIISIGMPRVCVRNTTLLGYPVKKVRIFQFNITSSAYKLFSRCHTPGLPAVGYQKCH